MSSPATSRGRAAASCEPADRTIPSPSAPPLEACGGTGVAPWVSENHTCHPDDRPPGSAAEHRPRAQVKVVFGLRSRSVPDGEQAGGARGHEGSQRGQSRSNRKAPPGSRPL